MERGDAEAERTLGTHAAPTTGRPAPSELVAVWCGAGLVVFLVAGFVIGGWVPPPSPAAGPEEIASFYAERTDLRRIGVMLLAIGGTLFVPFAAAIAAQLRRMEGPGSPMAATQLGAGVITATLTTAYVMMMLTAAFRLDRSPELIQAINDLAWIPFICVFMPGALQALSVAVAVLGAERPERSPYPRWIGWFSIWMAFTSLSGALVGFFQVGPFAWNGLIAFWVAANVFFSWFIVMFVTTRRAVRRQRAGELP